MRSKKKTERTIIRSSDNIYRDIGHASPDDALAKAKMAGRICDLITARKLTQVAAADILMIDQPRISDLVRGRLRRFSTDKLFKFLTLLDQDIEVSIKPKAKNRRHAEIRILAA